MLILEASHDADIVADSFEPAILNPHDLLVAFGLPGCDIYAEVCEMGHHLKKTLLREQVSIRP